MGRTKRIQIVIFLFWRDLNDLLFEKVERVGDLDGEIREEI